MAGLPIRCPRCQYQFSVPSAQPAAAPAPRAIDAVIDEDDELDGGLTIPLAPALPRQFGSTARKQKAPAPPPYSGLQFAAAGAGCLGALLLAVVVAVSLHGPKPRPAPEEEAPDRTAQRRVQHEKGPEQPPSVPPSQEHERPEPAPPASAPSLAWLEDATVFLKVKAGESMAAGTGFVIRNEGGTALIATNRHVVTPDFDEEREVKPEITAVFRSGKGPEQEESLRAEIVAVDSADEINHDLALLQVRGLRRQVVPLDPNKVAFPALGMKYVTYAFPRPDISFNHGNPSITLTSGHVSTLRNDDLGQLLAIQLDGSLQPGHSGGAIVDERGRLIGVAVAKVAGVDTMGLAIPADELRELLSGRVGVVDLEVRNSKSERPDLRVKAQVVDPHGRIKAVKVLVAPAQGIMSFRRMSDGTWPALPGAIPVDLRVDRYVATGDVQVALTKAHLDNRRVLVQTAHADRSGKLFYSRPRPYPIDQDGRIVASRKIEELKRKLARRSLSKLGSLVEDDDPKTTDECRLNKDSTQHKSTIALPPKVFSLSPQVLNRQRKPIHNAPRAMAEVEGDFLAYVQVDGDIDPGLDPASDARGRKLPFSFQGAGLLLYQDKNNFVRLERASMAQGASLLRELLVEVVREGTEFDYYYIILPGDPSAPLDLFLMRRKGRITCMFSHDGRSLLAFRAFSLDYPNKIKIGLTASNLSKKPFTAKFSDFVLLDDKLKLEKEFGD
jgi:S1-C subfamily serine protease/regulation of enolase protein 1 (concanavalin A-like superfamily)